jgi:hypothetical protein
VLLDDLVQHVLERARHDLIRSAQRDQLVLLQVRRSIIPSCCTGQSLYSLTSARRGSAPYAHAAWRYIETVRVRLDAIHHCRLVTRSLHVASVEISAINCIRSELGTLGPTCRKPPSALSARTPRPLSRESHPAPVTLPLRPLNHRRPYRCWAAPVATTSPNPF